MDDTLSLLAQRIATLRAAGIALFAALMFMALTMELPLAYPNLFLIGGEWLVLHGISILSQRKWDITVGSLTFQLLADLTIVASLLAFSGGVHNPFFALLLLPLLLSVGILPLAKQYLLLAAILTVATLLALVPAPANISIPQLHPVLYAWLFSLDGGLIRNTPFNPLDTLAKLGLWLNLLLMATITAFFLSRFHVRLQQQQQALQQATVHSIEQQHLLSLGLKAAATAHELSTPLATISLLASEAQDAYAHGEKQAATDALAHIQQLILTCKQQISHSLNQQHLSRSDRLSQLSWQSYLNHLLTQWKTLRPLAKVDVFVNKNDNMPNAIDLPQLTQTLTTLLNNAADASTEAATLTLDWSTEHVNLCLHNLGQGFSAEQLKRFPNPQQTDKPQGHGMGLTLAHASITKLGGNLTLHNPIEGGAQVCITLPINPLNWQIE